MSTVNFTLIMRQSYETNVSIKCSQSEIKLFAQKICKVNLSRCNSNDQEKKKKKGGGGGEMTRIMSLCKQLEYSKQ